MVISSKNYFSLTRYSYPIHIIKDRHIFPYLSSIIILILINFPIPLSNSNFSLSLTSYFLPYNYFFFYHPQYENIFFRFFGLNKVKKKKKILKKISLKKLNLNEKLNFNN
jgi:hypothetical protein